MVTTSPPPSASVTIVAPQGIPVRFRNLMMMVEFAPGIRYRLSPGVNQFMVPPGRYAVRFWSPYVWMSVATAQLAVDLRPGTPVTISYATPSTIYGSGVAGFGPTPPPVPRSVRQFVILGGAVFAILLIIAITAMISARL